MHSFSSGIADGKASSVVLRTNIPAPNQILEGIEALNDFGGFTPRINSGSDKLSI
jgi:hypothetical protein